MFIAYFGGKKCNGAQHEFFSEDNDAEVTPTGPGECYDDQPFYSHTICCYIDFLLAIITLVVIGRNNIAFRSLLHDE